jgi:hypothetical protein
MKARGQSERRARSAWRVDPLVVMEASSLWCGEGGRSFTFLCTKCFPLSVLRRRSNKATEGAFLPSAMATFRRSPGVSNQLGSCSLKKKEGRG